MSVIMARLVRRKNYHALCSKGQVMYIFYWIDRNKNIYGSYF